MEAERPGGAWGPELVGLAEADLVLFEVVMEQP